CEIMNDDGTMSRLPELVAFAQKHGLKVGTISDLIAYRRRYDNLVKESASKTVTSAYGGEWCLRVFTDQTQGAEHIVLTKGDLAGPEPVLVRMHALNPLEDALGIGPKPHDELPRAMQIIADAGRGAVVLLRDPGMKLAVDGAVSPQILRQYGLGAQILSGLGITRLTLVTDSPLPKVVGLEAYDLVIEGTHPIFGTATGDA
ncbi:MAG: 3,4-dihydroxy-2-butanone-4-phosphate synthase, partial [Maritimibacter sp.]|nr:3,4-dihydroxy-2-butanone-4-phosphate synthase [Maritimibacter sp.]